MESKPWLTCTHAQRDTDTQPQGTGWGLPRGEGEEGGLGLWGQQTQTIIRGVGKQWSPTTPNIRWQAIVEENVCVYDWATLLHSRHQHNIVNQLFSSVAQSCPTFCDPMDCSTPSLPAHHQLLEFTQTHVHWVGDALHPSHPLLSPSPPAFNLAQN